MMRSSICACLFSVLLLSVFVGCLNFSGGDSVVCDKPYIRVGVGCCLDRDDNRICDSDETTTSRTSTSAASSSSSTTTTTSTTPSTTTTTTTSTTTSSMTTTTLALPVSERAFKAHIVESEGYQKLLSRYGESKVVMAVISLPYDEAQDSLRRMRDNGHDDCGRCYDFSGGMVWGVEFGANVPGSVAYACMIDRETGVGAMYYYRNGDFDSCWCDTI